MIQEIINSLKHKKVLSCVTPSVQEAYERHTTFESIFGVKQGGRNLVDVANIVLVDGNWIERDYNSGVSYCGEMYLVQWKLPSCIHTCLIVFEK